MRILQRSVKNVKLESEISMKKFFFIKIFLILYLNVNTFRIIYNTWKALIAVSKTVNDPSQGQHILQKLDEILIWYCRRIHTQLKTVWICPFFLVNFGNPADMFIHEYKTKVMLLDLTIQDFLNRLSLLFFFAIRLWKLPTCCEWS